MRLGVPRPERPDPLASFSDHFGVDADRMRELGVFDPVLELDSAFAINPKLLDETDVPELKGAHDDVLARFADIMTLLAAAENEQSITWKQALRLFKFPEVRGASLGFSSSSGDGRGWPATVRKQTLKTAKEIVDAGIRDPRIFELVGLFQEGVGPDLISDMLGTILTGRLITYTQRICANLGVATSPQDDFNGAPLPTYIGKDGRSRYVILIPENVLNELPQALDQSDIAMVAARNEEVRDYLNKQIGTDWLRRLGQLHKRAIRDAMVSSPSFTEEILRRYDRVRVRPYNFRRDPSNRLRWIGLVKETAREHPPAFTVAKVTTIEEAVTVIRELLIHFRYLVEQTRVKNALFTDEKRPRSEKTLQDVFHGVAATHSIFTGLDPSPEVNIGRGPVDYKFSLGREIKILVELKLASNQKLVDGYAAQLPAYAAAEQASHSFYLVVNLGGETAERNLQKLIALSEERDASVRPEVVICDARLRPSASKLRRSK